MDIIAQLRRLSLRIMPYRLVPDTYEGPRWPKKAHVFSFVVDSKEFHSGGYKLELFRRANEFNACRKISVWSSNNGPSITDRVYFVKIAIPRKRDAMLFKLTYGGAA